jgi:hypothetical protein
VRKADILGHRCVTKGFHPAGIRRGLTGASSAARAVVFR